MTWIDRLTYFSLLDFVALGGLVMAWLLVGWLIEHPPRAHPSTSQIMSVYRRFWMREMTTRVPRIFDAQIVSNLRQGTAFFASTSALAIGGTLAVMGNAEMLSVVANDLVQQQTPIFVLEVKLAALALMLTNAFLQFAWANRLFGYAAVVMGAVPNDINDPKCLPRAEQAAQINIISARSFNRGLRSVYFSLALCAWMAGAAPLLVTTAITLLVILRREFASKSRTVLLSDMPQPDPEERVTDRV